MDVLIVGGGPVGLYLAAVLLQQGVTVRVLEQRLSRAEHSRAIGIHPPALAALDRIGVASALVSAGVPIRRGMAIGNGVKIAQMSFSGVSGRFPFVLSVPQKHTEAVLEQRVRELDAAAVLRGARVHGIYDDGRSVTLDVASAAGISRHSASLVVAADGVRSTVRELLHIPSRSRTYPDTYLMGDFEDNTPFGPDAVLFLAAEGIVESFPLPGRLRRWVARLSSIPPEAGARMLCDVLLRRTGYAVDAATNTMLSSFGVRSSRSLRLVNGRTALIGDAAHEVSPIGGQGMNLGWLDAVELAPLITASLNGFPVGRELRAFDRSRRRAAIRAMRQAEVNMTLGRPLPPLLLTGRNQAIRGVAAVPAANALIARRFTMQ